MAKNDFISDNLVHMRDRLKENAAKAGSSPAAEEAVAPSQKLSERAPMRDMGAGRGDDSARRKRELAEKLERDRAMAAAAIEVESRNLEELRQFEHTLEELEHDFGQLGPIGTPEGMRELEKLCFTHYRAVGRLSAYRAGALASSSGSESGTKRRYWAESLPVMTALVLSALIVAATLAVLFY